MVAYKSGRKESFDCTILKLEEGKQTLFSHAARESPLTRLL